VITISTELPVHRLCDAERYGQIVASAALDEHRR